MDIPFHAANVVEAVMNQKAKLVGNRKPVNPAMGSLDAYAILTYTAVSVSGHATVGGDAVGRDKIAYFQEW